MKELKIFVLFILIGFSVNIYSTETKIKMTTGNIVINAVLYDSETSNDFIKTLPRTLSMNKYDDREFYGKIGYAISNNGEKIENYVNGDVTYYSVGGSFAIFYAKDNLATQGGLIRMGKIISELSIFNKLDNKIDILIEVEK